MVELIFNIQEFSKRLIQTIEANLKNEHFGVSELAREMNMERSTLHRKVRKYFDLSVSQFINQIRLKKALELFKKTSLTVSETAYECGFHSATYFSKCFHDYYGFPPGKIKKQLEKEKSSDSRITFRLKQKIWLHTLVFLLFF